MNFKIGPFNFLTTTTPADGDLLTWDGTNKWWRIHTLVTGDVPSTLTGKRVTPRVVVMADATSFTPTGDTADINTQTCTQGAGTLTANAPSGTPTNGQVLELVLKCTNAQTFAWNRIYVGCTTTALPTATTGSTKTDRFFFQYNSLSTKWELFNAQYGYV